MRLAIRQWCCAVSDYSTETPANSTTNIIRVRTEVPNPADLLHPNMTGYAKMTGAYMPTWNAYTQMFERFFLVQFWYWIP